MKIIFLNMALMFTMICAIACSNQNQVNNNDRQQQQQQSYATPEEAAQKGKSDLLSALRSNNQFNLGIDAAALENAQPGRPMRMVELSFDKLLAADTANPSLDALVASDKNTVVPLVGNNTVLTIVEVNKIDQNWRVAALGGKQFASDLTTLGQAVGDTGMQSVTIYEVPNLQVIVYGVKTGTTEMFYTNYGGRFSLRQGVGAADLIPMLKRDAAEFQRKFGDQIKRAKLLK